MRFCFWLLVLVIGSSKVGAQAPTQMIQRARESVFQVRVKQDHSVVSLGTAFFVSADGKAITNFHVVVGGTGAEAVLGSKTVPVELVAVSPGYDLALLQVAAPSSGGIKHIPVRKDAPSEGEEVWALGFPKDLGFTVNRGIISGLRPYSALPERLRAALRYDESSRWVQTDCTINSGNSGGPLLDEKGQLVGVNTWVWLEGNNLYFALSHEHVKELIESAPSTPLGFQKAKEQYRAATGAHATMPSLAWERKGPAGKAIQSISAFRSQYKCTVCSGAGIVRLRVKVGEENRGGMVYPVMQNRTESCSRCEGTGYQPTDAFVRIAKRMLHDALSVSPDDPRAESVRNLLKQTVLTVASLRPDGLPRTLNDRAVSELSDVRAPVGEFVIFMGTLEKDHALAGGQERVQVISVAGKAMAVVLTDPMIVDATPGEPVLVGARLAGRVDSNGTLVPVLQSGFVVSAIETRK